MTMIPRRRKWEWYQTPLAEAWMPTGHDRNIFLSTLPASRRDRAVACTVVGISAVLFACAVPFARTPLAPLPAFVAGYQSALAVNDLITTVFLLSQLAV